MIERARPLLGTLASVRAPSLSDLHAIEEAFAAIGKVQAVMSAFASDSDLTRLHGQPCGKAFVLHPLTRDVVAFGLALSEASDGLFDMALGGEAAAYGSLPRPIQAHYDLTDVQGASWHDLELVGDTLILKRPLWLDLSGIAKGFAVDQGLAALKAGGVKQGVVNIGGDLAVFGPDSETIHLRLESAIPAPHIDIENAALASSGGAMMRVATRHVHGRLRAMLDPARFAAVIAPDCMTADALTKITLCADAPDRALLAHYSARALRFDGDWHVYGEQ